MEQTDPRTLLVNIARIFERLKIPYLVTGGMAVFVWGRPRFTADIDVVMEIKPADVKGLGEALRDLGEAGYFDEDVANEVVRSGGEFNFIDGVTGIKVDFWISSNNNFDLSRFERRTTKEISSQKVYFTSAEDLVLSKLKWYKASNSNRHLEDAESILKISGADMDMNYLREWVERLELEKEFGQLAMK